MKRVTSSLIHLSLSSCEDNWNLRYRWLSVSSIMSKFYVMQVAKFVVSIVRTL